MNCKPAKFESQFIGHFALDNANQRKDDLVTREVATSKPSMELLDYSNISEGNMEEKLLPPDLLSWDDESSPRNYDQDVTSNVLSSDVVKFNISK